MAAGFREIRGGSRLSRLTAFVTLAVCALLEAGGDALVRKGMHAASFANRLGLYLTAAMALFAYGWLVNRPPWSFGSLLGSMSRCSLWWRRRLATSSSATSRPCRYWLAAR